MSDRAGRGSLAGRWTARGDGHPNLRGAITLDCDLKAGSKLWLAGWTRSAAGCEEFVALVVSVASGGPRKARSRARCARDDLSSEPEGKFSSPSRTKC